MKNEWNYLIPLDYWSMIMSMELMCNDNKVNLKFLVEQSIKLTNKEKLANMFWTNNEININDIKTSF